MAPAHARQLMQNTILYHTILFAESRIVGLLSPESLADNKQSIILFGKCQEDGSRFKVTVYF